ncbi:MAG TPA: hypothetical protein VGI43_07190 [Mucilaginibacter sp.]|jgi:hypothetical protein
MKKIQTSIILLLIIGVVSCKKNENNSPVAMGPTGDEVAAIVANSLAVNTSGLTTNFNDMAVSAPITIKQACGTTVTDSTTNSGTSNGTTYHYILKYTHALFCNPTPQADNITFNLWYHGSSNGLEVNSLDTGMSTFKIAGLTTQATVYDINGEYKRTGAFTSNTGDHKSGFSSVDIIATNLLISKATGLVTGGTAPINIVITIPSQQNHKYTFNASATWNANGTATLTGINGQTYTVNLFTGVVSSM